MWPGCGGGAGRPRRGDDLGGGQDALRGVGRRTGSSRPQACAGVLQVSAAAFLMTQGCAGSCRCRRVGAWDPHDAPYIHP